MGVVSEVPTQRISSSAWRRSGALIGVLSSICLQVRVPVPLLRQDWLMAGQQVHYMISTLNTAKQFLRRDGLPNLID